MQKQKKFRHVEIRMFHYLRFEVISILKLRLEMKYSTIVQMHFRIYVYYIWENYSRHKILNAINLWDKVNIIYFDLHNSKIFQPGLFQIWFIYDEISPLHSELQSIQFAGKHSCG